MPLSFRTITIGVSRPPAFSSASKFDAARHRAVADDGNDLGVRLVRRRDAELASPAHRLLDADGVARRGRGVAGAHDVVHRLLARAERRQAPVAADRRQLGPGAPSAPCAGRPGGPTSQRILSRGESSRLCSATASSQVPRLAPKWPPISPTVSMMYSRTSCASCWSWSSSSSFRSSGPATPSSRRSAASSSPRPSGVPRVHEVGHQLEVARLGRQHARGPRRAPRGRPRASAPPAHARARARRRSRTCACRVVRRCRRACPSPPRSPSRPGCRRRSGTAGRARMRSGRARFWHCRRAPSNSGATPIAAAISLPVFIACMPRRESASSSASPATSTYWPPTMPSTPIASDSSRSAPSSALGLARLALQDQPVGLRHQPVAGQDRDVLAEGDVAGRAPAAQVVVVHRRAGRRGSASTCARARSRPPSAAPRPGRRPARARPRA